MLRLARSPAFVLALAGLTSGASATNVSVSAAQGATTADAVSTDGSTVTVTVDVGQGMASATGNGTALRITAADTVHFTVSAPGASALNDSYFSVLGGGPGPIALTFNFGTLGQWTLGDPDTFSAGGSFSAFVESATGQSPQVVGGFNVVNCVPNCGGRISAGSITTREDYYGPGAVSTVAWEGANPGSYALQSTFTGEVPNAGRLRMNVGGGVGNAALDFTLYLHSITTDGPAGDLSVVFDSGQAIAVTSAVPEPAGWALMLAGVAWVGWRRRASSSAHSRHSRHPSRSR
jgi:hypothetical protein